MREFWITAILLAFHNRTLLEEYRMVYGSEYGSPPVGWMMEFSLTGELPLALKGFDSYVKFKVFENLSKE